MTNWEVFVEKGGKSSGPSVTLQKRGLLGLNGAAHRLLGYPSVVVLLFEPDGQRIGIRAAEPDNPNGYVVRPQAAGRSCTISANAFLRAIGRYGTPTRRYAAEMEGDVLVMDLGAAPGEPKEVL